MARRLSASDAPPRASVNLPQIIPAGPRVDRDALMPGHRVRHDGWTRERTQRFLDTLAHTGCVRDAARVAGVSNQAGYRLKRKFPAFAAAWDDALERARQGLIAIAYKRAVEGRETVIIREGKEHERRIEPSDAMLGLLIKRGDLAAANAAAETPAASRILITRDEWAEGWRVSEWSGEKYLTTSFEDAERRLEAKFAQMRARLTAPGRCGTCGQPLSPWLDGCSHAELVALGMTSVDDAAWAHIEVEAEMTAAERARLQSDQ